MLQLTQHDAKKKFACVVIDASVCAMNALTSSQALSISGGESQSIADCVIAQILNGAQLKDAVKSVGMTPQSFFRLLTKDKAAAIAYARAQEIKGDLLADEVVHLADSEGDPAKVRNQMQARQWLASKLNKRYSERIDLNVTQTLDISSTLAEARARLLPERDLGSVIDAQVIDSIDKNTPKLSDKQSLSGSDAPEPDIFS